jgi:uncharacterized hydrophobic protein (TIGR00271 family)
VNDAIIRLRERWINPATVRGAVVVLIGILILGFPTATREVVVILIATGLVLVGITDIWAELRSDHRNIIAMMLGLLWIVGGVLIVAFGREAFQIVFQFFGAVIAIRGVVILVLAIRNRTSSPTWVFDIVRSCIFVAAGLVLIVIPETLGDAVLVIGGFLAIILGGIVISFGVTNPDEAVYNPLELGGIVRRWIEQRDVGDDMRLDVVDNLYFEPPDALQKQVGFWTLLVLSVVIATLGVLADSTAVVIGAMLVAPLMTPIMGVSAAIVSGWLRRISTSFLTIVGGVIVAVTVAWIVARWTPQLVPLATNSQILSRVSPTMIDLMIAVAAGAAGAYALVDRRVSSSITGVAIAVALVPPLGVVGVMLQASQFDDALGAFLLFLTNLVSIILAGSIVFLVTGFAPVAQFREAKDKVRTIYVTVVLGAIIVMVPLVFTSNGIIASATRQAEARSVTAEWASADPDLTVILVQVDGSDISVQLSGQGTVPSVDELQTALEESLGIDVSVTVEYFPTERYTANA